MTCVVRLKGGLGNQLFQYAAGRSVAHRLGLDLFLDTTLLDSPGPSITPWKYGLTPFNVAAKVLSHAESRKVGVPRSRAMTWLARRGLPLSTKRYVFERSFSFDPVLRQCVGPMILEGYWQSEKYFLDVRDMLLSELAPAESEEFASAAAVVQNPSTVSVHVRRGDYVSNPAAAAVHGVCDFDYYRRAFDLIESKVSNPQYVVFSDDLAWVRENEAQFGRPLQHASDLANLAAHQELLLMSRCSHNVIANSSFSWWGAWLNRNPAATVVAPARWFAKDMDTSDLYAANWNKA